MTTTPNPTPTQPETLEGCPFCPSIPSKTSGGNWWFIRHQRECLIAIIAQRDQYIRSDHVAAWSTRRAADAGQRNDATRTARNRDEAQDIIVASEEALGQCFDAATRHDLASRITEALAAATSSPTPAESGDQLVDEVQHRMDQVVEAAVEWHQAGREGGEWFDAAEKLSAAIDSLLELRDTPHECFCGTELEAGLCPNGHDPVTPPRVAAAPVGDALDSALKLLNEDRCGFCGGKTEHKPNCDHGVAPPESTRVAGEQRLLTPEELADIERFQQQRRKSPVPTDAWLYVAEIDRLLTHIRLDREQLENEIFQDATDPNFAATPADNDAESLELLRTSAVLCISGDGQPRVSLLFKELEDAQAVHEWLVRLVHGKSATPTKGDR